MNREFVSIATTDTWTLDTCGYNPGPEAWRPDSSSTGPLALIQLSSAIRNNIIGPKDWAAPSSSINPYGLRFQKVARLIAENNVISTYDLDRAVNYSDCRYTQLFNNRLPNGTLCRGYDNVASTYQSELEDIIAADVEDTLATANL
jgi:hypothetical protein